MKIYFLILAILVAGTSNQLFAQPASTSAHSDLAKVDQSSAEHYVWGKACDGWHYLKRDDINVIRERVPAGEKEVMHYHKKAR